MTVGQHSRLTQVFRERAKSRRQRFDAAWKVIEAAKGPVSVQDRDAYRRYRVGSIYRSHCDDIVRLALACGAGLIAAGTLLSLAIYLWIEFGPPKNSQSSMGFLIASMIAEWLTAAVLVYFGHIKSSFALATLLTVAFGSLLVASGAELFELPANTSVHRALELGVFYGSLGLIFLAATPFGCIYLYMLWYVRRLAQKVPEDIILAQIFMMLRTLDAQPLRFSDAAVRARLAVASHRAAVVFERFMPGRTGVQDVAQMKVIDLRMRKAGGKFREYQSWLSLPQHDTRDVLIEELSSVALAVTSGRYHELPEAAIDERDRSKSTAAIRVAKSLAAGLAPLALLWLFDILKISSSGTPWDAIKIFCYVWTSVSVLILLDPLYTAKITSAKEVVGLLGTLTGLLRKGEKP